MMNDGDGDEGKKGKREKEFILNDSIRFSSIQFSSVQFNSVQSSDLSFTSIQPTYIQSYRHPLPPLATLATLASISSPLVPVVVPSTTPVAFPVGFRNNKPNPKK